MTLITHFWTRNISVIAGDRRLTNNSKPNPIVSEDTRKIYANKNSFIAYHGDYDINAEMTITDLAKNFYSENLNNSVVDIADKLNHSLLQNRNRILKTGFIIGGYFNNIQAVYYANNEIIYDHQKNVIGCRFNWETEDQRLKLRELLNTSIEETTINNITLGKDMTNTQMKIFSKYSIYFMKRLVPIR